MPAKKLATTIVIACVHSRLGIIPPILILTGAIAAAQADRVLKEGDRAPVFSITTDQGRRIGPSAPGGSLLVLNFWETSCVPCVAELPSLSAFASRFRSRQVVVLAVSGDDDPRQYSRFLRDHHIGLETYRDPSHRIAESFGTTMYPETYLIQDGRIIRKVVGGIDWMNGDIASFVEKRLAGRH